MRGMTRGFDGAFYSGAAVSPGRLVPTVYECAIDGTPYLIDWKSDSVLQFQFRYKHTTLPIARQQADSSTQPGEHTLSPDGLWRRAMESWHGGAGQTYFDRPNSDPYRFNKSENIDVWTRWQFSLLPALAAGADSGGWAVHATKLIPVGSRLYAIAGQKMSFTTTNLSTWTDCTGLNASSIVSATSDGFHVYVAQANGVGRTDTTTGAVTTAWNTTVPSVIRYCNGHLLCGVGSLIKEITAAATTTTIYTPVNDSVAWVDFTGSVGTVYAAAVIGNRSSIYRINYDPLLGTESVTCVAELPVGEVITCIQEYLGFVFIGLTSGWRFATPTGGPTTGFLQLGALVKTDVAVNSFSPNGEFMYYTAQQDNKGGLARIDPSVINVAGVPAYAIDSVDAAVGVVTDIAYFNGGWTAASASGLWGQSANKATSGYLDSGCITYGLPDTKIAVELDVRHNRLADGSHEALLSADGADFVSIGVHSAGHADGEAFLAQQTEGDRIEIRHSLTRGTTTSVTPVITRQTLKSTPRVQTVLQIQVPLIMAEQVIDNTDSVQNRDPDADYDSLLALRASQKVVQYQEYNKTWSVIVDDVLLFPGGFDQDGKMLQGTCVLQLKTLDI